MSKRQIAKLLEKNLAKAGFKKQPYAKFDNYFFDSAIFQSENPYESLRNMANLSRDEVASIIGISSHTIRKYESNWNGRSSPPKWYYIMLRLLNGDLSFYGKKWKDVVIQHHDRKLRSQFSQKTMEPFEMNAQYNRHFLDAKREAQAERNQTKELKLKLNAMELELAQSHLQIELLTDKVAELEAKKSLTEKGKLIPLFSNDGSYR